MGIHTADAIVLRQYPYRETSVIVTCLTDRYGKLRGLVKGLRGERARHRSAMEPLSVNRIVFYDTRTSALHLISQCDLLQDFSTLSQELDIMRVAASCAELTDILLEPDEPHPMIFHLLHDTLARLAAGDPRWPAIRIHFVLHLLRLAGFHPQLDECTTCSRQPLTSGAYWSVRHGGLLCDRCLHEDPPAEPLGPAWLELFSRCAEATDPLDLEAAQAAFVQHRLDAFLRWHLDRPLKTLTMDAR